LPAPARSYAVELELLPAPTGNAAIDAGPIARLLKSTPGLDKAQIGQFIGKGPAEKCVG